ncbi:MAG TPA: class I SAM-dependent methyltransferase [Egibacteraceae bacterium]|nr:class I SAM-dependent methyltransferase [Egibacteraceae bacterium]
MDTNVAAAAEERIERTVAAYDAVAEEYQEAWRQRRPLDAVRKFGGLVGRGGRILDVACGPALDVRLLRDVGLKVVGGDRSQQNMRVARKLFPKGSLARWDFRRLPFPDTVFDGIWAPAALHHLPRAQIRRTLAEWRRVQRRGPIFVTFRAGSGDLAAVEDPPAGTVWATSVTGDQLRALLLDAGYGEVEVETRPDLGEAPDVTWLYGWGRIPE